MMYLYNATTEVYDPKKANKSMNTKNNGPATDTLRYKAEESLKKKLFKTTARPSEAEALKLIQELEVHKIELEMQNEELQQAKEAERLTAEKYIHLYDFAPLGYFTLSNKGVIVELNLEGSKLLGKERLYISKNKFVSFVSDNTKPAFNLFFDNIFKNKEPETCELQLGARENLPCFVHLQGIISEDNQNCLVTVTDITTIKLAEEKIIELNDGLERLVLARTTQLRNAFKELEAFSHTAAHDLRTPLRALSGYADILLEDYTQKVGSEGKRMLEIVAENANKMGVLIDNLIIFTRLNRQEIQSSLINMYEMANSAYHEQVSKIDKKRIKFHLKHIPPAFGDESLVRQVWVNLINNAFKFSSPKTDRCIVIGLLKRNAENIYFIKDNGIGFDMVNSESMFEIFKRLHNEKEFEGIGVGLSIARRIIQRHNGRIWAEGIAGEGATFYFTLPGTDN
jgi:signal transduction histidine kinase